MTHLHPPAKPLGSFVEQPKFRPEVQGLRSLAVLLVVTYHVWFGRVSGGVDVFLFISAFLLSLSSLRKIQAGKPLRVVSYWLHVFQRLLPAAATVIAGTLVASYFIIAPARWASLLDDAQAALFYFLNWRLAFESVDYYAQDATLKTPFQHFWSLSMQGQIFILWPLLFAVVALLVRYLRLRVLPTALLIFGSVFVASLTFSVLETANNQAFAYFDTRTRLWEFAAGTLLALLVLAWRVPQVLKVPLGWLGVIGLVTCGWLLPVEQAFPGYLALWPLLSAAFVIAAGQTGSALGVDRILSAGPLQKMGAISYCLYLVHWPILILYTSAVGKPQAGWLDGTLIILASIAGAWVLHTLVEKPLRAWEKKPSRRALKHAAAAPSPVPWDTGVRGSKHKDARGGWVRPVAVIAACLLLIGGFVLGGQRWLATKTVEWATNEQYAGTERFPGALAADTTRRYADPAIPMTTDHQRGGLDGSCEVHPGITNPALGDTASFNYCWGSFNTGFEGPLTVVAGDSHAHHTALPVFQQIASTTNTNIISMLRPGCRFSIPEQGDPEDPCYVHNQDVYHQILEQRPDNVVLITTRTFAGSNEEIFTPYLEPAIAAFTEAGINVIGVRDNPRWEVDMFECAQNNLQNPSVCGADEAEKLGDSDPGLEILNRYSNAYSLDFTPVLCPNRFCDAVVGNIIVYMDDNHINRSYALTMTEEAERQLAAQGWDPHNPAVRGDLGQPEPIPAPDSGLVEPVSADLTPGE